MKQAITRISALACAAVLASCSSVTVTTDYDTNAPFAKYRTYKLAPAAKGQTLSPSSESALCNTFHAEMTKKGLIEKKSGEPDLAIARHVSTKEKLSVHGYTDYGYPYAGGWPYGYGRYSPWAGAPRNYVDVSQYTEGTLVLDFIDTKSNKLVFRGTGSAIVGKPQANAEKISEAVTRMVADFPTR